VVIRVIEVPLLSHLDLGSAGYVFCWGVAPCIELFGIIF